MEYLLKLLDKTGVKEIKLDENIALALRVGDHVTDGLSKIFVVRGRILMLELNKFIITSEKL